MAIKRLAPSFAAPSFQPIATINTTPLIDLMLVLIIMFIVIIPMPNHKVPLDLPRPRPGTVAAPPQRLGISAAGDLSWNGRPLADAELPHRLERLLADPARPDLHIAADAEARYERVDTVLAQIKRAGVSRLGFVGNQAFIAGLDGS